MTAVHYTYDYLLAPRHPITVHLIGAGGTGSQVLSALSRMDVSLRALGHPGLFVSLIDPDTVSEANMGRQLFSEAEVGLNKAVALITRVNRFFGLDWRAVPERYDRGVFASTALEPANFTISCTDTVASRLDIGHTLSRTKCSFQHCDYRTPMYWMDWGNGRTTGQVVLGSLRRVAQPRTKQFKTIGRLPTIAETEDLTQIRDEDSGPSCSMAEALAKQDLFINSALVAPACSLLWKMIRTGYTLYRGFYLNLDTLTMNPIPVDA